MSYALSYDLNLYRLQDKISKLWNEIYKLWDEIYKLWVEKQTQLVSTNLKCLQMKQVKLKCNISAKD
jgi:hypothetical protein